MQKFLVAILLVVLFAVSCLGKNVFVNSTSGSDTTGCGCTAQPCLTPNFAVKEASRGDVVVLSGQFNLKDSVYINKDLTLVAFLGEQATFDCNDGSFGAVVISKQLNVEIRDIVIQNCRPLSRYGAGIMTTESDLVLTNVIIRNNSQLRGEGAGLAIFGGNVLLQNSIISGNSAVKGAGISCSHRCNLTVIQSSINSNIAVIHGGGIKVSQHSQVVLEGSFIENNHAASGAGLASMGESDVVSINTVFEDNKASSGCDHVSIESGGLPSRFEATEFLSANPATICLTRSDALFSGITLGETVSIDCNHSSFLVDSSKLLGSAPKCNNCKGTIDGEQVCQLEKKGWFW